MCLNKVVAVANREPRTGSQPKLGSCGGWQTHVFWQAQAADPEASFQVFAKVSKQQGHPKRQGVIGKKPDQGPQQKTS